MNGRDKRRKAKRLKEKEQAAITRGLQAQAERKRQQRLAAENAKRTENGNA